MKKQQMKILISIMRSGSGYEQIRILIQSKHVFLQMFFFRGVSRHKQQLFQIYTRFVAILFNELFRILFFYINRIDRYIFRVRNSFALVYSIHNLFIFFLDSFG